MLGFFSFKINKVLHILKKLNWKDPILRKPENKTKEAEEGEIDEGEHSSK